MKNIVIGQADFSKIIEGNAVYVDKTREIFQLVEREGFYFLARPRRFGKSLLCSTMQYLFEGRKELFEGLWIYDHYDWAKKHPVLYLSFAGMDYRIQGLEGALSDAMNQMAARQGLQLSAGSAQAKFKELIEKMSVNGSVAVLIDEYDKPIIDYLEDTPQAVANRGLLKSFYGILKDNTVMKNLRLVFITGVSKFSKVSLFSDLNHLSDISLDEEAATLTGITQVELEKYFGDWITLVQEKEGMTREAILAKIKNWYNGYSWDGEHFVYNPFSLLCFFQKKRFDNYWFDTGTPTMLVNAIRNSRAPLEDFEQVTVDNSFFKKFDIENIDLRTIMFQTGYLTIKSIELLGAENVYNLSYPNEEVTKAFHRYLIEGFTFKLNSQMGNIIIKIKKALIGHDVGLFIQQLTAVFSDISYHLLPREQESPEKTAVLWEGYFQSIIYLLLSLIGVSVQTEITKSKGRMDAVIQTDRFIYILEFKLGDPEPGMAQIKEKQYAASFVGKDKTITLLAIGFDPIERNVGRWLVEEIG